MKMKFQQDLRVNICITYATFNAESNRLRFMISNRVLSNVIGL